MIEFRNVTYTVSARQGRRNILEDVSFKIEEGEIAAIMGTSGSGKTTTLRLMAGLLQPDSGEVLINGRNIVGMREHDLNVVREEMGFVFQYSALFDSLTVAENVGFKLLRQKKPKDEVRGIVERLLADVGLPGIQEKLPGELSGGMRKRVAMARAVATNPSIVLYDEPDSGLDPVMTRVIDELILELRAARCTTNVVVSHNVQSVFRIADRMLMLFDAKLVANGTTQEVQASAHPAVRQFLEGRAEGPILAI